MRSTHATSSRKLADVTPGPGRASRIERKAAELTDLRKQIAEMELRKTELSAQLLKLVKAEGEPDLKGKIRYESDTHRFVVIESKSTHLNATTLLKLGVKASLIKKATTETPYEYVRVDERKDDEAD